MTTVSLHVVTSDMRRGAETFAIDLAACLEREGHSAEVVALFRSGSAERHDVRVLGRSRRSLQTFRALRSAAAQADVVVAHGSSTLEACGVGLAGTGIPFVYRTIGDPSYWVTSAWRRKGVHVMLRRAARNVVLWPDAARQLASLYSIPQGRIDVVPNGVVASRFPAKTTAEREHARDRFQIPRSEPCLGFVGSLSAEKDVGTLVEALQLLQGFHLLVAGEGPHRAALEERTAALAPGRVRYLGPISDPREVYTAVDVLVLPSLSEGMPAVIIEAGLVGTPTVATEVGAISEMITDGVTGFLTPSGDSRALAKRIAEVLPRAREVGHRAHGAFAERYTMDTIGPRWVEVLERACR